MFEPRAGTRVLLSVVQLIPRNQDLFWWNKKKKFRSPPRALGPPYPPRGGEFARKKRDFDGRFDIL